MFCVLIAVDKEAISILHLFQITYQLFVSYVCIIIQGFGKCNTFLQKNEEKREKMSHFIQIWSSTFVGWWRKTSPNELFSLVSIVRTFSGHTVGKVRKAECGMKRYLYLAAGTFLMAAAYKSIYQSVGMVTGGFSGIGVIVNRVTGGVWAGGVPLWITNVTLNVPLFIAAFYIEGKEFIKNTVTGAVLLTLYLAVLPAVPVDAADYLLAAVYGGAACGAGIGLVLKSGFTTGGTDMLGVLLHRFFRQYALASIIQVLDMAVIIAGVLVFGMSVSLYAIIAVYVTALVTDTVLEGTKQARAVWIISDKNEQIAPVVMEKMHRGITRFPASGVYTQQEKSVLLCVVSIKQIPYLKEIVMEIDENSFLIVGDVREVMGNGFVQKLQ